MTREPGDLPSSRCQPLPGGVHREQETIHLWQVTRGRRRTVAGTAGDGHTAQVSLIHNESTKLLANALDRASTACFAIGALAPTVAVYSSNTGPIFGILVTATVWILVSIALHVLAQRVLKGLRP